MINRIIHWLLQSNRWKHLAGGALVALCCIAVLWLMHAPLLPTLFSALYATTVAAACLELKDYLWGGRPDWVDFLLTVLGAVVVAALYYLII